MDRTLLLLTFEDGPFSQTTPFILDVLKSSGIKAIFFVTRRSDNLSLIQEILAQGHLLGFQNGLLNDGSSCFGRRHSELTEEQLKEGLTNLKTELESPEEPQLKLVRGPYGVQPSDPKVYESLKLTFLGADASWSDRSLLLEDGPPSLREKLSLGALKMLGPSSRWVDKIGKVVSIPSSTIIPDEDKLENLSFPPHQAGGRLVMASVASYWTRHIKTPTRRTGRTVLRIRESSRFIPSGLREMLAHCAAAGGQFVEPQAIFVPSNGWVLSRVEDPAPTPDTLEYRSEQGQVSRLWTILTGYLRDRWGQQHRPTFLGDSTILWGVGSRLPTVLPDGFWDQMEFFRSPIQASHTAYKSKGFLQFLPKNTTLQQARETWEKVCSGQPADEVLQVNLDGIWALLSWELCDALLGRLKPLMNLESGSDWSAPFENAPVWQRLEALLLPDHLKLLWIDLLRSDPGGVDSIHAAVRDMILKVNANVPTESCLARLLPQQQKLLASYLDLLKPVDDEAQRLTRVRAKLTEFVQQTERVWIASEAIRSKLRDLYGSHGLEPADRRKMWFHTLERLALIEALQQQSSTDLRQALEESSGDRAVVARLLQDLEGSLVTRISLSKTSSEEKSLTEDALTDNEKVTEKFKKAQTIVFFLNGLGGNAPSACVQLQERLQEFNEQLPLDGPRLACFNGDYDDLRRRPWTRTLGLLKGQISTLKEEVLTRSSKPKVIIIGHSLGGQASLQAAEIFGEPPSLDVELLAPLDPIEAVDRWFLPGSRASIPVGAHVKRLFHFWTPADTFFWAMNFNSPTPFALVRQGDATWDINGFHQGSSIEYARGRLGQFSQDADDGSLQEVNHAGGGDALAIYQDIYLEEILFQTITKIHLNEEPPDFRPKVAVYWCSRDSSRTILGNDHFLLIQGNVGHIFKAREEGEELFRGTTLSLQDPKQDGQFELVTNSTDDITAVEEWCKTTAASLHLGAPDFDLEIKLVPVTTGTVERLVKSLLSAQFDSRRFKPQRQGRGYRNYTAAAVEALLLACGAKQRHLEQLLDFNGADPDAYIGLDLFTFNP